MENCVFCKIVRGDIPSKKVYEDENVLVFKDLHPVLEIKDGKRRTFERKIYPGYVLVKMILTDDIWYIVRNTRGVTGFVGPSSTNPVPLTDDELGMMGLDSDWEPVMDYDVGDEVRIINGPLEGFDGKVDEINIDKKKVTVIVSMFGRETPVELELTQVIRQP
jgi:transcriptional antiterminator NusG